MISYLKEHFKDNSPHIQAIFTSMLYIILHTVSSNLSRALYRLIQSKKHPVDFPTRLMMLANRQIACFYTHLPFSRIIRKKEVQLMLTFVN